MHFLNNIATANELAEHVQLRYRGPTAKGLDAIANRGIVQNIDGGVVNIVFFENGDDGSGETAHGLLGIALHVEHDRVFINVTLDHGVYFFFGFWHGRLGLRSKVVMGR